MSAKPRSEAEVEQFEKADGEMPNIVDGEEDDEAPEIRGVDLEDISPMYWRSFRFLGSAISIVLLAICLYVGFSLPVGSFFLSFLVVLHRHEMSLQVANYLYATILGELPGSYKRRSRYDTPKPRLLNHF